MSVETEAYIKELDQLRSEVGKAVHGMSAEELNTAPLAEDANSPVVLATHIAGSERFWIHQVAGGIDVHRDRDSEFLARVESPADLVRLMEVTGAASRDILRGLSDDDLGAIKAARPGEEPVSVRSAILHQVAHMAQHLGHLNITMQLYRARR